MADGWSVYLQTLRPSMARVKGPQFIQLAHLGQFIFRKQQDEAMHARFRSAVWFLQ